MYICIYIYAVGSRISGSWISTAKEPYIYMYIYMYVCIYIYAVGSRISDIRRSTAKEPYNTYVCPSKNLACMKKKKSHQIWVGKRALQCTNKRAV